MTFLLLITVLSSYSSTTQQKSSRSEIDSLRHELIVRKGAGRISVQLELALQLMEIDVHEAQLLAKSALSDAKIMKERNLQMVAYFRLAKTFELMNKRTLSEAYYDSSLTFTSALSNNWYKGEILFRKGVIKHNKGEDIQSLEYFNASLQACRLSNNFKIMASSYSMMGAIFRVNGLYDRAIEYIVNSKLNYEKAGFKEGYAWAAYLLGRINSDLKLPKQALEFFEEALAIYANQAVKDGDDNGVAICYEQIGMLHFTSGNFKEASRFIDSTKSVFTRHKSEYGLSNSYKNLGMIEYSMGNFDLAEKYLNESLKVKIKVGDLLNQPTILEYLGLCHIGKGQREAGFLDLKKGLDLAISNQQKRIQLNIYSKLAEAYLGIHDLKNAIYCQKMQIEVQDLLLSGAADIKIEQLQAIYEIDKKNRQIIELEDQNKINSLTIKQHGIVQVIMVVGILAAILFSISIFWFYNRIRHKNQKLKESNAAKDKFFAIIAHDLRGPTWNLASFLEYINESFSEHSPEELKKILLSLYKSAENVSVLLENLLIWAQSQLNKIEFCPVELKLEDLIQKSIKGLKQSADNKEIDIRLEMADQISVVADPNMVQTIMRNVLGNAIKFTNRGGSVTIRTELMNTNMASIQIIDTGVGIEAASLSKIFDITTIQHTAGTENEHSTGLGLILVKDFVERNRGTLAIQSQKGEGTTVSFTLPVTQGQ